MTNTTGIPLKGVLGEMESERKKRWTKGYPAVANLFRMQDV